MGSVMNGVCSEWDCNENTLRCAWFVMNVMNGSGMNVICYECDVWCMWCVM